MYRPRIKQYEFPISTVIASGTGTLSFTLTGNRIVHQHLRTANSQTAYRDFQGVVPQNCQKVVSLVLTTQKLVTPTSAVVTLYVNGVADTNITNKSVLPNTASQYVTYIITPSTVIIGGDTLHVEVYTVTGNSAGSAVYVLNANILYVEQRPAIFDNYFTTGNESLGNFSYLFRMYYGYERQAMIYTAADVQTFGTIKEVSWYINSVSTPATANVQIYMKQTASSTFASSTTVATEISGGNSCL